MLLFGLGIGVILILTLWLFILLLSIIFYKRGLKTILPFLLLGIFLTTIILIWPKEKCKKEEENKFIKQESYEKPTYYPIFFSLPLLIITTITILFLSIKQLQITFLKPFDNKTFSTKMLLKITDN
ncbi:Hypothetical protein SRAE_X000147800 [Strongyloides ratti]|uniref:Uncharacterized protein n=1 Tax=Strongyloides ratti TaxID=34506 RepID=A0A090KQE5_STRRB|nr:Hypothetical protein SRAE_X000147800 [Strongyloides ratti]CEF59733.1 Hypothetical protein SRAE_X000147800 [Strongyloides ratti]